MQDEWKTKVGIWCLLGYHVKDGEGLMLGENEDERLVLSIILI